MHNQIKDKVMQVDQWLEIGFHLCKQRWDSSMDWLEEQPVSKVLGMIQIMNNFNLKQNEEMKNAGKTRTRY